MNTFYFESKTETINYITTTTQYRLLECDSYTTYGVLCR